MNRLDVPVWNVTWSDCRVVHEQNQLDEAAVLRLIFDLQKDAAPPAPVVEVFKKDGASMSIALGRSETVLTLEPADSPPYYISVGNPERKGLTQTFCHGNQAVEHMARNLICWDAGIDALKAFLRTGERSGIVQWEQL